MDRLTARQVDIMVLVASGLGNKQIASALTISEKTVNSHLKKIFTRLDAPNRASAVVLAYQLAWIDLKKIAVLKK